MSILHSTMTGALQSSSQEPSLGSAMSFDSAIHSVTKRRGILLRRTQSESLGISFDTMKTAVAEGKSRNVSFDAVQIHEHLVLLGDNPGGNSGPPLSLDWKAQACYELPLDKYEEHRPERRSKHELALPDMTRIDILRNLGYSRVEIVQLTKPVNIARTRRRSTIKGMKRAGIEEFAERVSHKTLNMLSFGRRKREERIFLEMSARFDVGKVCDRNTLHTEESLVEALEEDSLLEGHVEDAAAQDSVEPLSQ